MKTAIIYASTHGTTEKVARKISKNLPAGEAELIDLKKTPRPELSAYSRIIIGGSVHAGSMQKRVSVFCQQNIPELLQKPLALFICGMEQARMQQQFEGAFHPLLRAHACCQAFAGGELLFERMNFLQKMVVRKVSGVNSSVSALNPAAIKQLAETISKQ